MVQNFTETQLSFIHYVSFIHYCAKVTGSADSICYRLNLKIKAAEPSPVEEFPSCISCRPARGTGARQSKKKLRFVGHETPPHCEHVSFNESGQVTTVSIGVRAGGGRGGGGAAAPPTAEIISFFGQNALDYSGNDT